MEGTYQPNNNRKLFNRTLATGFFIIFLTASFWLGFYAGKKNTSDPANKDGFLPVDRTIIVNKDNNESKVDFSLFWNVYEKLKKKYVEPGNLDSKKLLYGAIKGMLAATGDPYTTFLDPDENKKFEDDLMGSFEGIGAEMGIKGGILTVISPLVDSPAEKSGLRAGDKIIKIDDKSTADMILEEAVSKLRGPKGTEVKVTIWRNGNEETQDIVIKRDIINVKSVKLEFKENEVALVKISRFGDDTSAEFSAAASQILSRKAKGIIIDLRNNPGGYLDDAVNIAGKMLPKDTVAVIEETVDNQKKILTKGGNVLGDLPLVIIINEGSASASEILSGALKDNRKDVVIVGRKSFGKGSVQEKIELPEKTAVKVTVARWLTPAGKQINEQGISPDVEVNLSNDDFQNDRDPQLDKALEIINEKIKNGG